MAKYTVINPEDIPEDLPPGKYTTRVDKVYWDEEGLVIEIKYIGALCNSSNMCLFPLTKD
jgi:hypothetical protein